MYPEWSKRRDGMVFHEKNKSRFVDLEWSVQICFSIQNLVIQNGSQQYFIQDRISLKELKNHIIMLLKRRETQAEKCLLTGQKGYLTIWNLCIYIYILNMFTTVFSVDYKPTSRKSVFSQLGCSQVCLLLKGCVPLHDPRL